MKTKKTNKKKPLRDKKVEVINIRCSVNEREYIEHLLEILNTPNRGKSKKILKSLISSLEKECKTKNITIRKQYQTSLNDFDFGLLKYRDENTNKGES